MASAGCWQGTPCAGVGFCGVLITLSMTILTLWVNLITAVLTFTSLIGYAVIYTVYLKRTDVAEHCDWWFGRRDAAYAGLGCGHGVVDSGGLD